MEEQVVMAQELHLQNNMKGLIQSTTRAQLTPKAENFKDLGDTNKEVKMGHSKYG
jgi:hypothetical protein